MLFLFASDIIVVYTYDLCISNQLISSGKIVKSCFLVSSKYQSSSAANSPRSNRCKGNNFYNVNKLIFYPSSYILILIGSKTFFPLSLSSIQPASNWWVRRSVWFQPLVQRFSVSLSEWLTGHFLWVTIMGVPS